MTENNWKPKRGGKKSKQTISQQEYNGRGSDKSKTANRQQRG